MLTMSLIMTSLGETCPRVSSPRIWLFPPPFIPAWMCLILNPCSRLHPPSTTSIML
ncbi:hypothetical protein FOCG_17709 [Fusarium oxysporum f. sp. radicis-lycopersici 26381]|nr:hypothetical protein FOCG_17709 [Fusarium oxysporum f. sp. radicis-lycopersici 26381]